MKLVGLLINKSIKSGSRSCVFISLVDMYAKCASLEYLVGKSQARCNLKSGLLNCHGVGSCEMWAKANGTTIVLTNAIGRCVTKLCYIFGGVEWMC